MECPPEPPLFKAAPYRVPDHIVEAALRAWCEQQPPNSIRRRAVMMMLKSDRQTDASRI
jgi:hypothetical protein